MIALDGTGPIMIEAVPQLTGTLRLDQIPVLYQVIRQAEHGKLEPEQCLARLRAIRTMKPGHARRSQPAGVRHPAAAPAHLRNRRRRPARRPAQRASLRRQPHRPPRLVDTVARCRHVRHRRRGLLLRAPRRAALADGRPAHRLDRPARWRPARRREPQRLLRRARHDPGRHGHVPPARRPTVPGDFPAGVLAARPRRGRPHRRHRDRRQPRHRRTSGPGPTPGLDPGHRSRRLPRHISPRRTLRLRPPVPSQDDSVFRSSDGSAPFPVPRWAP